MNRVYEGDTAVIKLKSKYFPFSPDEIKSIEFRFYTTNPKEYILKSTKDIVDDCIILKWSELIKLNQGVLLFDYKVDYGILKESEQNTTNYFLMTGEEPIIPEGNLRWGNIKGDINAQLDLIEIIPVNVSQLTNDSGYITEIPANYVTDEKLESKNYAVKDSIPTKVSQLTNDSGYITEIPENYVTDKELEDKGYITMIPLNYITSEELESKNYAVKDSIPTNVSQLTNDSGFISSIPSNYVTNEILEGKGYLTDHQDISHKANVGDSYLKSETYSQKEINDKIKDSGTFDPSLYYDKTQSDETFQKKGNYLTEIPSNYVTDEKLDAKGYLTEHQDITGKVDKVNGKSLIADTEITRLSTVVNYDDTSIKGDISLLKSDKLDINVYNEEKKGFALKTELPTKISELQNDNNTVTDGSYVHTDNNFTTLEKTKLSNLHNTVIDDTINDKSSNPVQNQVIKAELDKKLDNSAISDMLTKTEAKTIYATIGSIPANTSDLTNDSGFITKAVTDLSNYYIKSQTFTQQEVKDLVGSITTINFKKVDVRPETGKANLIYLVPKKDAEVEDVYDEWIYIDNTWEHIGTTQVDLSNYYTIDQTNAKFALQTSISDMETKSHASDTYQPKGNYLTKHQDITGKVDKVNGKSLISDSEITRLSTVVNYDDTGVKKDITALKTGKADKSAIPTQLPANGGNSATVNGHTVLSDVPLNAIFTDTKYTLSSFGLTATKDELNYCDGVTSNIQDQIDSKVSNTKHESDLSSINTTISNKLDTSTYTTDKKTFALKSELVTESQKSTWNNKVDKVTGKGLSTNDYTAAEKTKVSKILTDGNGTKFLSNNGVYNTIVWDNISDHPTQLPADGGNSATVNGHTVLSNVPADAKFTDTVYDDTNLSNRVSSVESQLNGVNTLLTQIVGE